MSKPIPRSPAEERIEEIRARRQQLLGGLADNLARLRELGSQIPQGAIVLRSARPLVPLGAQLAHPATIPPK